MYEKYNSYTDDQLAQAMANSEPGSVVRNMVDGVLMKRRVELETKVANAQINAATWSKFSGLAAAASAFIAAGALLVSVLQKAG